MVCPSVALAIVVCYALASWRGTKGKKGSSSHRKGSSNSSSSDHSEGPAQIQVAAAVGNNDRGAIDYYHLYLYRLLLGVGPREVCYTFHGAPMGMWSAAPGPLRAAHLYFSPAMFRALRARSSRQLNGPSMYSKHSTVRPLQLATLRSRVAVSGPLAGHSSQVLAGLVQCSSRRARIQALSKQPAEFDQVLSGPSRRTLQRGMGARGMRSTCSAGPVYNRSPAPGPLSSAAGVTSGGSGAVHVRGRSSRQLSGHVSMGDAVRSNSGGSRSSAVFDRSRRISRRSNIALSSITSVAGSLSSGIDLWESLQGIDLWESLQGIDLWESLQGIDLWESLQGSQQDPEGVQARSAGGGSSTTGSQAHRQSDLLCDVHRRLAVGLVTPHHRHSEGSLPALYCGIQQQSLQERSGISSTTGNPLQGHSALTAAPVVFAAPAAAAAAAAGGSSDNSLPQRQLTREEKELLFLTPEERAMNVQINNMMQALHPAAARVTELTAQRNAGSSRAGSAGSHVASPSVPTTAMFGSAAPAGVSSSRGSSLTAATPAVTRRTAQEQRDMRQFSEAETAIPARLAALQASSNTSNRLSTGELAAAVPAAGISPLYEGNRLHAAAATAGNAAATVASAQAAAAGAAEAARAAVAASGLRPFGGPETVTVRSAGSSGSSGSMLRSGSKGSSGSMLRSGSKGSSGSSGGPNSAVTLGLESGLVAAAEAQAPAGVHLAAMTSPTHSSRWGRSRSSGGGLSGAGSGSDSSGDWGSACNSRNNSGGGALSAGSSSGGSSRVSSGGGAPWGGSSSVGSHCFTGLPSSGFTTPQAYTPFRSGGCLITAGARAAASASVAGSSSSSSRRQWGAPTPMQQLPVSANEAGTPASRVFESTSRGSNISQRDQQAFAGNGEAGSTSSSASSRKQRTLLKAAAPAAAAATGQECLRDAGLAGASAAADVNGMFAALAAAADVAEAEAADVDPNPVDPAAVTAADGDDGGAVEPAAAAAAEAGISTAAPEVVVAKEPATAAEGGMSGAAAPEEFVAVMGSSLSCSSWQEAAADGEQPTAEQGTPAAAWASCLRARAFTAAHAGTAVLAEAAWAVFWA